MNIIGIYASYHDSSNHLIKYVEQRQILSNIAFTQNYLFQCHSIFGVNMLGLRPDLTLFFD